MQSEPAEHHEQSDWRLSLDHHNLSSRMSSFNAFIRKLKQNSHHLFERTILSPMDRTVLVKSSFESGPRSMIMLGSNNYLGFANHSQIKKAVTKAMNTFGIGMAGPSLLNGTGSLHRKLEEELSELKGHEDTCLFPSGYQANLAIAQALISPQDFVIFDEQSHASFIRGLRPLMHKQNKTRPRKFRHNQIPDLRKQLSLSQLSSGDCFVACESLYSMSGDIADLNAIHLLKNDFEFYFILDDAHGLGVLGRGRGAESGSGVKADISMGTFSKAMAVTGGYLSGNKELVRYLRYFGESGVFSASLPVTSVSAVLAGLKIIREQPGLIDQLHHHADYLRSGLRCMGYRLSSGSGPIISLPIPAAVNIREFNFRIHKKNIFVNSIEPPAVHVRDQMMRLSVSACHTIEDLKYCLEIFHDVGLSMGVL